MHHGVHNFLSKFLFAEEDSFSSEYFKTIVRIDFNARLSSLRAAIKMMLFAFVKPLAASIKQFPVNFTALLTSLFFWQMSRLSLTFIMIMIRMIPGFIRQNAI